MIKSFVSRLWSRAIILTLPLVFLVGCSDDDTTNPPVDDGIKEDLYPLTVGRQIVYSGMLRDKTTDVNIDATAAVYETKWTVASNSTPTPIGGTSNLVMDSTRVPTGIPTPPTIVVPTPLFVKRDPATGTADISFMQNIGPFFRRFGITRTDTLHWFDLAKLSQGVGKEWTAFDNTYTAPTGDVRLQVVSKWEAKEDLTVGGQTFSTYKLTTTRKVYLGGSTTPSVVSPTATLWLSPGIGPVKMILNADGENVGHYREFKSKNF